MSVDHRFPPPSDAQRLTDVAARLQAIVQIARQWEQMGLDPAFALDNIGKLGATAGLGLAVVREHGQVPS